MSEKRTGQIPPEPTPEPMPSKMELAEWSMPFLNFDLCQSDDLTDVVVGAKNLSRALRLAIGGLHDENEHSEVSDDDLRLLGKMAEILSFLCDQAKKLLAEGQAAATPAPESLAPPCTPTREPGHLRVIDGGGPRPAA